MLIIPDRWHDARGSTALTLAQKYKKPNTWFRSSIAWYDSTFAQEKTKERCITAALIFPRDSAWREFTDNLWTMVVLPERESWVMVIGNMADPVHWISQAQARGARAWYLVSGQPQLYQWRATKYTDYSQTTTTARTHKYNVDEMTSDLQLGELSDEQIASRHGVSRMTVHNHKKRLGLVALGRPQGRPSMFTDEQRELMRAEYQQGGVSIRDMARKYRISATNLAYLVKRSPRVIQVHAARKQDE
jgi:transposase-like protein